jgi:hypothetical protein
MSQRSRRKAADTAAYHQPPEELPLDPAYEAIDVGAPEVIDLATPYEATFHEGLGDCYDPCDGCGSHVCRVQSDCWARGLSLFAGAHGFKGPVDLGRNGNFGLHEGVNLGGPLSWHSQLGYQIGMAAVHSNFSGSRTVGGQATRGDRDQIFLTAGIFRRALCPGIQWGAAFDLMHDSYYYDAAADLKQFRAEISSVRTGGREVGFWGAFSIGDDVVSVNRRTLFTIEPTEQFAFFYRRYFESGGQGRLWTGFTGQGDGLLGADLSIPLGRGWTLENRASYLIPREGRGADGQPEEAWGLSIRLVWHLGRSARCAEDSPYSPLLPVADNSLFLTDLW